MISDEFKALTNNIERLRSEFPNKPEQTAGYNLAVDRILKVVNDKRASLTRHDKRDKTHLGSLYPCPYCDFDFEEELISGFLFEGKNKPYQITCPECNACGSEADTSDEAIARWNKVAYTFWLWGKKGRTKE